MEEARRCLVFDPRVGLALLVFANLAAFSEQPFWMEMIWIGFLLFLMSLHRLLCHGGEKPLDFWGNSVPAILDSAGRAGMGCYQLFHFR